MGAAGGPRAVGRAAVAVLVAALLSGFALPWVGEQVIASRLEGEAGARFGAPVEAAVDVAAPGALLRGRLAAVVVRVPTREVVVDGTAVTVRDTVLALRDVVVDVGDALGGSPGRVEVGPGSTLTATVATAEVVRLVRGRIAAERPDLAGLAVDVDGPDLRVTTSTSDGSTASVVVRPSVVPGAVVLVPVDVDDADASAVALADAVAGVEAPLPELPLGLAFDELVLDGPVARLAGRVPSALDLG